MISIPRHFFSAVWLPMRYLVPLASIALALSPVSAHSQFVLTPVPGLPGVSASSLEWGDYDNDGRLDFLLSGSFTVSLWSNTGNGFSNVTATVAPGLPVISDGAVAWGDFDNDGWLDFLVTGLTNSASGAGAAQVWRNTGAGFTNVPVPGLAGVSESSAAWGDFDNDGLLDFLITGLTNGAMEVSELWRNTGSGFTNVPIPDVPGNFDNALAWGDFDNDSRLDFLIAGTISGNIVSQLWRNTSLASNSPPAAPAGLSATVIGTTVLLKWNAPADDHTPASGLSYNVRIGTTPGGSDIVATPALSNGVLRVPQMGNVRGGSMTFNQLTPGQTYYWSVQAVDTSFAGSPFATEQQFSTGSLLINPVRHANGVFEFQFTNFTALEFDILASTNLTTWENLGPAASLGGGLFQFTDTDAVDQPRRFYLLREQ